MNWSQKRFKTHNFNVVRLFLCVFKTITLFKKANTAESAFLFRDRDRPVTDPSLPRHHPVTVPSLGFLNRPKASLTVL